MLLFLFCKYSYSATVAFFSLILQIHYLYFTTTLFCNCSCYSDLMLQFSTLLMMCVLFKELYESFLVDVEKVAIVAKIQYRSVITPEDKDFLTP